MTSTGKFILISCRLGTEKYLPEFFKKYEEDKKESKIIEDNRPEPRRMEKVLRYINNELNKNK